jgi:methionine-rich copper-binding protein CopC
MIPATLKMAVRFFLGAAIAIVVVRASDAHAHAFPDKTTPSAASALEDPPKEVVLHFDNQFDPSATKIRVLNENGDVVSSAGIPSGDHRIMTVPLKPLRPGQYFVKWSASSQDGDHTMGAYSFTVRAH